MRTKMKVAAALGLAAAIVFCAGCPRRIELAPGENGANARQDFSSFKVNDAGGITFTSEMWTRAPGSAVPRG